MYKGSLWLAVAGRGGFRIASPTLACKRGDGDDVAEPSVSLSSDKRDIPSWWNGMVTDGGGGKIKWHGGEVMVASAIEEATLLFGKGDGGGVEGVACVKTELSLSSVGAQGSVGWCWQARVLASDIMTAVFGLEMEMGGWVWDQPSLLDGWDTDKGEGRVYPGRKMVQVEDEALGIGELRLMMGTMLVISRADDDGPGWLKMRMRGGGVNLRVTLSFARVRRMQDGNGEGNGDGNGMIGGGERGGDDADGIEANEAPSRL
ncbi:hypothetical protein BD779DRAFT_1480164 [Infundibulicybe gibba]|nr:hypothetical protein BD779DRAFT_1480164 [Infundibulicybe gibba]